MTRKKGFTIALFITVRILKQLNTQPGTKSFHIQQSNSMQLQEIYLHVRNSQTLEYHVHEEGKYTHICFLCSYLQGREQSNWGQY